MTLFKLNSFEKTHQKDCAKVLLSIKRKLIVQMYSGEPRTMQQRQLIDIKAALGNGNFKITFHFREQIRNSELSKTQIISVLHFQKVMETIEHTRELVYT